MDLRIKDQLDLLKHVHKFYFLPTTKDLTECPKIKINKNKLELISTSGQTANVTNIRKEHLVDLGHSIFLFSYYFELDNPLFPELNSSLCLVADVIKNHQNIQMAENFDLTLLEKRYLIANPDYYDYIHQLSFKNGQVEMCDGGGQIINGKWLGNYTIDQELGIITCNYHQFEDYGKIIPINIKKTARIISIKTGNFLFRSYYSTENFNYEITLDDSLCPLSTNRAHNLFNLQEDDTYPTVFYFV